eukprot:3369868-Pleurochrysis_carterae.AAC.1
MECTLVAAGLHSLSPRRAAGTRCLLRAHRSIRDRRSARLLVESPGGTLHRCCRARPAAARTSLMPAQVHCDVHIFEWLMEYIHQPESPPFLDASSVISIVISADFLQACRC